MKRLTVLAAIISGFLLFGAQSALAVNFDAGCTALGGEDISVPGECRVSGTHVASGPITLGNNETLHILGTGRINVGTLLVHSSLTITITNGDFVMDAGALIDGNVNTSCTPARMGSDITITLDNGDVDMANGSTIRSNSCSGGPIKISTAPTHTINIDGLVESVGSISGTGGSGQAPGGGTITIIAGCELTVSDTGRISSRGQDPGADLVHLEGCAVVINGLVESIGPGHALPDNPANHCNLDPAAHPVGGASFYTACVEIWGNTVTINSTGTHKGEVSANGPRNPGRGWIDVFSRGDIAINNDTTGPYSVHANAATGGPTSNSFGGLVTVKSSIGKVTTSGFAISANATGGGSDGGDVIVQAGGAGAAGDVAFGAASIQATAPNGSNTAGGHIAAKSFNGSVTGTFVSATAGELNAAGGLNQNPAPVPGTVLLEACVGLPAVTYAGTVTGTETDHPPPVALCGGTPSFPTFVYPATFVQLAGKSADLFIAAAANCATTQCGGTCSKSGMKFNDANNSHTKDVGELGLPLWTITLWNEDQTALVAVSLPSVNPALTDAGGNYLFAGLAPGTYVVCETPQATWNQTFPQAGGGIVACANGTLGYKFTLSPDVNGCVDTGNDFGNFRPARKSGVKWNDVNGDGDRDPGDNGLGGWTINLWDQTQTNLVAGPGITNPAITAAGTGAYQFNNLLPGTYVACEVALAGWTQTFPVALGGDIVACTHELTRGWSFQVAAGDNHTGNDFGNHRESVNCPEDPNAVLTKTVIPSQPQAGINYQTVQAAYDAAGNNEVIGMFGNTNENLNLGGAKTLKITQCTSARVTGAAGSPVWNITSTGKLTIVGPDSVGGQTGWLVGGNGGHTLKSVRANGASLAGIAILSNNNTVSWNDVSGNAAGIVVNGNSNTLKGGTVGPNTGDGVQLNGNNNSLSGATLDSNTGSGVVAFGSNNQVKSNKANSNGHDGFWNFGGAGNNYSGNSSNTGGKPNGLHQYEFTTAGVNGGSNRADGVNVPKTSAPTKCADFAQAGTVCD